MNVHDNASLIRRAVRLEARDACIAGQSITLEQLVHQYQKSTIDEI